MFLLANFRMLWWMR